VLCTRTNRSRAVEATDVGEDAIDVTAPERPWCQCIIRI
jgi:hypothetical protein